MTIIASWLRRVARSAHSEELVVRGSLVTRHHFSTRAVDDVDHLALGKWDDASLRSLARSIAAEPDEVELSIVSQETIWPEAPFPGLRTVLHAAGGDLQVDLGFGDPLTIAPSHATIEGVSIPIVAKETMVAWKLHGLVELGPRGRWRDKDLHDLDLYATLSLDDAELSKAIATAFVSHGHAPTLLDSFLDDPTWGTSKGSQKHWRAFARATPTARTFGDVMERLRKRLGPSIRAART